MKKSSNHTRIYVRLFRLEGENSAEISPAALASLSHEGQLEQASSMGRMCDSLTDIFIVNLVRFQIKTRIFRL